MKFSNFRFWFIIPIITVLLIPINSFSQDQELSKEIKKKYKAGVKYSKQGEDEKALKLFLEVYKSAPANINNLYFITVTYNDRLEDYTNAYKYGQILLGILNKELNTLNPRENKKKYEKAKDLIDEIELLVLVAKPKAGITETDESASSETTKEDVAQDNNSSEKDKVEIDENQAQNPVIDSSIGGDIESGVFIGFTIANFEDNYGKDEVIEAVRYEYGLSKKNQKEFQDVLNDNSKWQEDFKNHQQVYVAGIKKSELDLLNAIYNYNTAIYRRDSTKQIIDALFQKNNLLKNEMESISWFIDQLETDINDTLLREEHAGSQPGTFVGRCQIEKSLNENDSKRLLNDLKGFIQDHTDYSNPIVNGVISFINTSEDDKYLYLVANVIDAGGIPLNSEYRNKDENLEAFSFKSGNLFNLVTSANMALTDIGLKGIEIKIIQGMGQFTHQNLQNDIDEGNEEMVIIELRNSAYEHYDSIKVELRKNEIIKGSLIPVLNDSLFKYQTLYYDIKETYDSKFNDFNSYINYLVINEEIDNSKPTIEYFVESTDEIFDLAKSNLVQLAFNLKRLVTYIDSTNPIKPIRYIQDTVTLIPKIDKYKILSLSKVKFDNSDDIYFALNLGFEINYEFPDELDANTSDSFNAIQAYDPEQSEYDNETTYMPPVGGSYKILSIEGVSILQDRNNKQWKVLEGNPSSYTSYMMFQEEEGWRLPTYNELRSIISYLASNKNKLDQLGWANNGVIYLSSDSHYDNRNNEIYKGIKFTGSSYAEQDVQGGDEVYLIVVKE